MHVIAPPLVTPGNLYGMVITCSNNSLAFVISFDGEKQIERDSYCRNVKLVYMSTCTPNTLSDFLALIRGFPVM